MPTHPDGQVDKETVKAMFMASKHMNWIQFADDQGWDEFTSRIQLPVKIWIREKRDKLQLRQGEILSGLIHERKFKWVEQIIKTLDDYPEAIDAAMQMAKAKMHGFSMLYKDYTENFLKSEELMYATRRNGQKVRRLHPFEKITGQEIGAIMKGMKDITEAKLKALMLDKWAIAKLDTPLDDVDEAEGEQVGPKFTIEGKGEIPVEDMRKWMNTWIDKPPEDPNAGG